MYEIRGSRSQRTEPNRLTDVALQHIVSAVRQRLARGDWEAEQHFPGVSNDDSMISAKANVQFATAIFRLASYRSIIEFLMRLLAILTTRKMTRPPTCYSVDRAIERNHGLVNTVQTGRQGKPTSVRIATGRNQQTIHTLQ